MHGKDECGDAVSRTKRPEEEEAGVCVPPRATASGRAPVLGEDECGDAVSRTKRPEEEEEEAAGCGCD